jgi:hypothetical protein
VEARGGDHSLDDAEELFWRRALRKELARCIPCQILQSLRSITMTVVL